MNADFIDYIYEDRQNSYNSFGQVGLIQLPSAESKSEGSVFFSFNNNEIWKIGTLTVSPFDWLEASYFYYRPSDLIWEGTNKRGDYLDKGFNVKFSKSFKKSYLPTIAVGLDDFAGTGYFSREYFISTYELKNLKITSGLGWGKYSGESGFKNPLGNLIEELNIRPESSSNYNQGGTPSYDQWFRGDASLFGGMEWFIPKFNGLKFKVEYDPFNYFDFSSSNRDDALQSLRLKESNINYGISIPLKKYGNIDFSYVKGNTLNITFSIGATFNKKLVKKPKIEPKINRYRDKGKKINFYEDLLINMNKNSFFLQTASLKEKSIEVAVAIPEHRNHIRSASYSGYVVNEVAKNHEINLKEITVAHLNAGLELNNITLRTKDLDIKKNTQIELVRHYSVLDSGNGNEYLQNEFIPELPLPAIFSNTGLTVINHIGAPEQFYFGGLVLQNASEILLKRNLILTSEINFMLADNFRQTISGSNSVLPHVRTDIVSYLIEGDKSVSKLQLDYIWSPRKDVYARVSGGFFEQMYGGIGGELLYKPFKSNIYVGLESFWVKKRGFNQRFTFLDYSTVTSHISVNYLIPKFGIEAKASFGKYLAKDTGFTIDLSRTTKDGFKAGIYFTRTNVSAEDFGEGSFDKGFYFQIPFDLFSTNYTGKYTNLRLSPLTRDGGQKLVYSKDLIGLIHNSNIFELNKSWNGFFK